MSKRAVVIMTLSYLCVMCGGIVYGILWQRGKLAPNYFLPTPTIEKEDKTEFVELYKLMALQNETSYQILHNQTIILHYAEPHKEFRLFCPVCAKLREGAKAQ